MDQHWILDEKWMEGILRENFQKNLEFELNGKTYKRGKFSLYRIETYNNNYEIIFLFETTKNKPESFKIPYPFKVEYYPQDGQLFFDYRLLTLSNGDSNLESRLLKLASKYQLSKYFNKILTINIK